MVCILSVYGLYIISVLYSFSGRLRGSTPDTPGTHTPVIKIAMEPGGFQDDVILPFPASEAWQWVSTEFNSEQLAGAETMLVVLAVEPVSAGASTSASGTAFFDDLTVTFSSTGGLSLPFHDNSLPHVCMHSVL